MYMPPEQARGDLAALSPASDVFSLGAVLFQILSGRYPFDGAKPLAVMMQVILGKRRPLEGDLPIPVTLADICLIPQLGNARRFGARTDFPRIEAIDAACARLPPSASLAGPFQEIPGTLCPNLEAMAKDTLISCTHRLLLHMGPRCRCHIAARATGLYDFGRGAAIPACRVRSRLEMQIGARLAALLKLALLGGRRRIALACSTSVAAARYWEGWLKTVGSR